MIIQTVPEESETLVPAACTVAEATIGATNIALKATAEPTAKIFFATEFCIFNNTPFLDELIIQLRQSIFCLKIINLFYIACL
jgi:hypothetical protein